MMKCPRCNKDIPDLAQACPFCKEVLQRSSSATIVVDKDMKDITKRGSTSPGIDPQPPSSASSSNPTDTSVSHPDHGSIELSRSETMFEQSVIATRRYKMKKLLGRGGMGLVYYAFDNELGLEVAVKSLPPEASSDPRSLEMLKQEAKLSMQLTHHNIVRLYDLKEAGDSRFMVMEYVPGFSLSEYILHRKTLTEEEAWKILRPVGQALAYAHSQNIIHRDIKPGNILFKTNMTAKELADYYAEKNDFPPDTEIKVADFGIARTVTDSLSRVTHAPISGTLAYMSREQVRGKHQTQATDIYSLAVVAYEMLCGHPPFYQGDIQYQVLNEDPEPLPGVKDSYMQAIFKALNKDSEQRPATVLEFLDLAEGIAAGALSAPDSSGYRKTPEHRRSSRKYKRIIVALAVALAVVLIYVAVRQGKPPVKSKPDDETSSIMELAWKASEAHKGRVNAVGINASATMLASAGENVVKLWKLASGEFVKTIEGHQSEVTALAFSPKAELLASADKDGRIMLEDLTDGSTHNMDAGGAVRALCFSPDGATIASAGPGAIKLWKADTGEEIKSIKGLLFFPADAIAFSPDGEVLVSGGANSTIKLWEVGKANPKEDPLATIKGNFFSSVNALAFSPVDNKIFASAGSDKEIKFWESPSGQTIRTLSGHNGAINAIVFSATGKTLASSGADRTIRLWSVASGDLLDTKENHFSYSLAFSGRYLASGGCGDQNVTICGNGEVRVYKLTWQPSGTASAAAGSSSSGGNKSFRLDVGGFLKKTVKGIKEKTGK
jgi:serine/threonine protein kinase/WD40 repeat protein